MTHKLIRDKIPELALSDGIELVTTELSAADYAEALKQKLVEEAMEAAAADRHHLLEELADCEEVIQALAKENNISLAEIETVRIKKLQTNGGFEKRLRLIGRNRRTQLT